MEPVAVEEHGGEDRQPFIDRVEDRSAAPVRNVRSGRRRSG